MRRVRTALLLACLLHAAATPAQTAVDWTRTVERVGPAVVEIATVETTAEVGADGVVRATAAGGLGSGALISADGLVLTAAHVVATADVVEVKFRGVPAGLRARVIAASPRDDVALLRLEQPVPPGVRPLTLGESAGVAPGEPVLVIGAPYGLGHSVSAGVLSARHAAGALAASGVAAPPFDTELLQTDAAINQGNSGGPLFDRRGRVIGVVSYILSRSGGFDGIGFAVGSDTARRVLLEQPAFWSGASTVLVVGPLAAALQVPQRAALLVQRVTPDSPASRLGLRGGTVPAQLAGRPVLLGGDLILAVEGIPVDGTPDALGEIERELRDRPSRAGVRVRVLRDGRTLELAATPALPPGAASH